MKLYKIIGSGILLLGIVFSCQNQSVERSNLAAEFKTPPHQAKPKTWMHAMSGNMSKEGLTKDLESMANVGIGGLLLFNITQGIPNGPVVYNSPEHHAMITHAAIEAERLGLSFGVHNCDGWSSSGGPWITPEDAMKMVVWSQTIVRGGRTKILLKQPSTREGFYKDIAVIAYPSLSSEINDIENEPIVTTSDPGLDITIISDGKIDGEVHLTNKKADDTYIQYSYTTPKTIRSVYSVFNDRNANALLQTSKDGENFETVKSLFKVRTGKNEWAVNDHFDPITSKYFRLKFSQDITLKEAQLHATYFINNPLGRTSMARTEDAKLAAIGKPDTSMVIDKSQLKNLTAAMDKNGQLTTDLPPGNWTILRFGYTTTGALNHPASDQGRGLEVDKLSKSAFKKHYDAFLKKVIENASHEAPNALQYAEIDSYEMGGQNWTEGLETLFEDENGYSIFPFLPLIAGRFIESAETSGAVLWDYRQLICNLMTENYFAYFTESCHNDGIKSYIEPYGFGPLNDLDIAGKTDIPMGEFWMNRPISQVASAISGAHIYGKPVISAEAFTSRPGINWNGHPAMAKTSGDLAWTMGINEFMFHRFAHQANTFVEPGMTMNRWGFHFDRTQTWWENAGAAWFRYIARGSHMLRQGFPVSDLLIYVGEGAPNSTFGRTDFMPPIPMKINFDNTNTDVLINRIKIQDNALVLPEGTSYKILVLKNSAVMSLKTLQRIHEIAKSGIPIIGETPKIMSGYSRKEEDLEVFGKLAAELATMITNTTDWDTLLATHNILPDLVFEDRDDLGYAHRKTAQEDLYFFFNPDSITRTFNASFRVAGKIPELWNPMNGEITKKGNFSHSNGITKTAIKLHAGASVFVVFRADSTDSIETTPHPMDHLDFSLSDHNKLMATVTKNGHYSVPLHSGKTWNIAVSDIPEPLQITGRWEVNFKKKHGYGQTVPFDTLTDWKDHPIDSINYYSGTATYTKSFTIPKEMISSDLKALLDLGDVFIVADVSINGKNIGVSWMPPFQADVSNALKAGENILEIALTNQWSNKLIGDERYPANDGNYRLGPHRATDLIMPDWYVKNQPRPKGSRTTFTTAPFYKKNDPLTPSGLLGPVQIKYSKRVTLKNN